MRLFLLATTLSGTACLVGSGAPNPVVVPDGGGTADPDGTVMLSGRAVDYFGDVTLAGATLATEGISPQVVVAAGDADGGYAMQLPIGSTLFVIANQPGYRPTRNAPHLMSSPSIVEDVYALSTVDVKRQYTTLGRSPTPDTAIVIMDVRQPDGTPITGISLASATLTDRQGQAVPGVLGPYAFGSAGDLDPAAQTIVAYGTPPRARIAFLDVPAGAFTISVTSSNVRADTSITTDRNGASLVVSGTTPSAGSASDPHFETDIYPRLQKAANGGLGCANCHTAGGPGAVLVYDDPVPTVLASMRDAIGVLDPAKPADSLFLTKPLYEPSPMPQNHPNATFLDTSDPDYKLFLLWITNGTPP